MRISTLVIATHNLGKLREFRSLLAETGWEVVGLSELSIHADFLETGSSFVENARVKALQYSRFTKLPVLADDSGLEVSALNGRPGIHSARYAGPAASDSDRVEKLLGEVKRTGARREARFVCALALAQDGALLLETEGECRGEIAKEPRGSNGFGYDPIFLISEFRKTFAELDEAEKNRISHRAQATRKLLGQILWK